jgi:hypothetical protein
MTNLKVVKLTQPIDEDKIHVNLLLRQALEWADDNEAVEAIVILRNKDGEVHTRDCMDDIYRGLGLMEVWKAEIMNELLESSEDD